MMQPEDIDMVFAFPDGSASFVNGFEAGMIWQEIDNEGKLCVDRGFEQGFPIHTENIELVRRMATARGYSLEVGVEADGWVPVRLTFTGTGKARPALRVVP